MLVWLTLPFYDFCGFRSVAVNSVYKLQFFYIFKIGLSRCVSTGVAWMDGRSRAAGTGKAASCGSGVGGAWLTRCAGTSN